MSIQQLMLGVGAKKKVYMDDVFSTYLYTGTGSARSINTGVDMTEGGLTWIRRRNQATDHYLYDTASGATKYLASNDSMAQQTDTATLTAFNNNGFSLGTNGGVNGNGNDFVGWSFRKAPGFFDVVTYTGTGSARTVAHSLGCVPGMVLIKKTSGAENWNVWHKSLPLRDGYDYTRQKLELNTGTPAANLGGNTTWNDTKPSATTITLGTNSAVNENNATYVAYFFAGGESTAATARSVDFDGTGDYLEIPNSSDYSFGSGDFTVEGWFNLNSTSAAQTIVSVWDYENSQRSWQIEANSSGGLGFSVSPNGSSSTDTVGSNCVYAGQWTHFAGVRDGNTLRLFVNGTQVATSSFTGSLYDNTNDKLFIGILNGSANITTGKISNIRVVKGTAVYTSSFKPPYEPLTNITNTKLLCCNDSSTTGSTVTSGTITANGNPTASTDSPFDDPSGFVFGESGSESVIKCGSYVGNGSDDGPEINLGFEPQWILFRNIEENGDEWVMYDSMRGLVTKGNDARLYANVTQVEGSVDQVDLTSTGFKITMNHSQVNRPNNQIIFVAIRRPDGYVGKPAELGTDVFNIVNGDTDGVAPFFTNIGFPADFALFKNKTDSSHNWGASPRLTQGKYLSANQTRAENANTHQVFDYMSAWNSGTDTNGGYVSWVWKRHAGFDVVTYSGNGVTGRQIPHSMGVAPEMMWVKRRNATENWYVYHKGHNNGSSPEHWFSSINTNGVDQDHGPAWADTVPTSTHFTLGADTAVNSGGTTTYIAFLFASVNGISKVGYYTGSDSSQTITTGFQPRFAIIRRINTTQDWVVLDTLRGWASGNDTRLELNQTAAQNNNTDFGAPISTGFTLEGATAKCNASGGEFIYYAHA